MDFMGEQNVARFYFKFKIVWMPHIESVAKIRKMTQRGTHIEAETKWSPFPRRHVEIHLRG